MSFHLIIGPMFSSKTVTLTQKATQVADLGRPVLYVRHVFDAERETVGGTNDFGCHSSSNKFLTDKVDIIQVHQLSDVDNVHEYEFIFVDEAQFYPDADDTITKWMNDGINVVAAGLSGDFISVLTVLIV